MSNKWRDPLPEEINTPEFNAVWKCIKHWDIGLPWDILSDGGRLYSGATGNHVVAILDALKHGGIIMALATITPAMQQVILIGMQLLMMQIEKDTYGMSEQVLIEEYIPKQQARQKRLKKQRDDA